METTIGGTTNAGKLAGRYTLGRQLGSGGMGAVFAATQDDLGRRVAIKMLHPHLAQRQDVLTRFRREALDAAALGHPNIVQVTDFCHPPGEAPFLVMEHLEGQTLRDALMHEGALPAPRVAAVAVQVLSALEAAHGAGITHRDLKPDNIFLMSIAGGGEVVKVLDFGLAKHAGQDSALTESGAVMGTPAYMAPEQFAGRGVGPLTDLYAVGAVMYHVLTGHLPFTGENHYELMFAITQGPEPSLAAFRPDLDPHFVAIVETAMQRDPAHRFTSAASMRAVIEPWVTAPAATHATFAAAGQAVAAAPTLPSPVPGPASHMTTLPSMTAGPHVSAAAPPEATKSNPLLAIVGVLAAVVLILVVGIGVGAYMLGASSGTKATIVAAPQPKAAVVTAAEPEVTASIASTTPAATTPAPSPPATTPAEPTSPPAVLQDAPPPAAAQEEQSDQPGLFGRFLGGGDEPEPEPAPAAAAQDQPAQQSEPVQPPPPAQTQKKQTTKKKKKKKKVQTGGTEPFLASINAHALLNLDVIRPEMKAILPKVKACYVKHKFSPGDHVHTNYHLFIGSGGKVNKATKMGSRERSVDLDKCLIPLLKTRKFGPTKTGEAGKIDIGYTARIPGQF